MNKKHIINNNLEDTYFNLVNSILIVLDKKGKIIDINKKGCQILKLCKNKIIGKNWFSNFLPKGIKKEVKLVFDKLLKGDLKEVEYYENPIIDSKGNIKLIAWHNTYLKDANGKIVKIISAGEDITEKRKLEKELNTQIYLFKTLFEYAPDGYFLLDYKGNFVDGNKKAEDIIGYKKSELIGKNIFKLKLTTKKYLVQAAKSIMTNLAGKQSGPDEYELIRKDGKKVFVEILSRPIQVLDKNLILCVARDITERKKILKQIELDSLILRSLLDPIFILNKKCQIIFKNEALDRILGVEDSLKELTTCSFLMPRNNKNIKEVFNEIFKKQKLIYEAEIISFENKRIPFEIYANVIKIENDDYILNICRDLTQRIKFEEEIRNTLEETNQILNSASSALFITSKDGIILKANKSFFDLFDLKEQEVLGKRCGEIFNLQFHDCFFKQIMAGEIIKDFESEIKICNGKLLNVLINAKPFKNIKGDIVGVIADFKDISKIKEAEKILQESYDRLKEVDAIKTTFFSMVSHELKNPLTSIIGFTTLLEKGAVGELNEKQKEFIQTISNNSNRLLNLINELLDMSRIESGTFSIQKKQNDIIIIIQKAIKEMLPIAQQKKIYIKFNSELEKFIIDVDEYRITQVIINILNNAIKFSPNNANIYITATYKNKNEIKIPNYIKIILEKEKYFLIAIKDEGEGIEEENLIKIFEKFYQIRKEDKTKGLGLGLFIAKAIVDAHSGYIWVESEGKNKGAQFFILLPI